MKIVNLTPHVVNVLDEDGSVVKTFPSETLNGVALPRLEVKRQLVGNVDGIPYTLASYGEPENLPEPKDGVLLIVSGLVRTALEDRKDLISPGDLVRDESGRPIGCRAFDINWQLMRQLVGEVNNA